MLSASVNAPTPPNGKKLTVCIQGRQFIWRYVYGNGCLENSFDPKLKAYSYTTMVVPEHTTVVLAIQSTDVIHSWWVPSLGGKVDAVPGYTTYTWFKALHTGTFRGQCAQLCGTNHAAMIAYVKVVTPDAVHRVGRAPAAAHRDPERPGGPVARGPHRLKSARKLRDTWRRSPAKTS